VTPDASRAAAERRGPPEETMDAGTVVDAGPLETDQLANLMTYTVFHIGVYITLGAAVIAGGAIKNLDHWTLKVALGCVLVAGVCGGVIAGSIPEARSWSKFSETRIGPAGLHWFRYCVWAHVEHYSFWLGVLVPAITYLRYGAKVFVGG
jgi:hypothetical protein